MERTNSVVIPPTEQETLISHVSRSTKNAFYSCFGCLQTSKEKTLIKYKEYEIEQRKKAFGITYINHKKQGLDDLLPECVDTTLKDIESFETEIQELKLKVASKEEETKSRLVPAPGTPVTAKPSTSTGPSASGTATNPPAAETAVIPPPETAVVPPGETGATSMVPLPAASQPPSEVADTPLPTTEATESKGDKTTTAPPVETSTA